MLLTSPSSFGDFPKMVGTVQQTINDFRSGARGTIRSSMMVASNDGGAMSSRDVLRVRNGKLTMRTTFLSICGCGQPAVITLKGRARVRQRAITYNAKSPRGGYSVTGTVRVKQNRITRTERRVIYDRDFNETDVFVLSSALFLQGRVGR